MADPIDMIREAEEPRLQVARLPFRSTVAAYQSQAEELFQAWKADDADAIEFFRTKHPQFRDDKIRWLARQVPPDEIRNTAFDYADAQLAIARWYDFRDWPALGEWVEAVAQEGSAVEKFESAVEAIIHGDTAVLQRLLRDGLHLIHSRSTRITPFDPPMHRATLLHYIGANGVEGYREMTPSNAVEVATMLLEAGADPNALADMYGGEHATMPMLVSSSHPAQAGLQVPLIDTLVDHGASVEPIGTGAWTSPLLTALAFGYRDAAEALVRRGAQIKTLSAAAGLGRLQEARQLLTAAGPEDRHRALALAAQNGSIEIVRLLLDGGEDANRYNPKQNHSHSTPLHQAVWSGHMEIVRLLVGRGARLDIKDTVWHGTPLGWAEYGGRKEITDFLRSHQGTE
jgi:Ankyrin repeats (3 copies)